MNTYRGQEREVKALSSGRLLSSQVVAQLEVAQEQVSAKAGEQPALVRSQLWLCVITGVTSTLHFAAIWANQEGKCFERAVACKGGG